MAFSKCNKCGRGLSWGDICQSCASACCGADATHSGLVSPRCGDGPIADKALHLYQLMKAVNSDNAAGFVIVNGELVRISIRCRKDTDHAHDGP